MSQVRTSLIFGESVRLMFDSRETSWLHLRRRACFGVEGGHPPPIFLGGGARGGQGACAEILPETGPPVDTTLVFKQHSKKN